MSEITVIINQYKRPEAVGKILDSLSLQTVKPVHTYIWKNGSLDRNLFVTYPLRYSQINCQDNLGVWARFAFALNCETEYVAIFDDDTIPGLQWFENCIQTMKIYEGLLGTVGLRMKSKTEYEQHERYGWPNPNEATIEVDFVGHAWFFKREWLNYFWLENIPKGFNFVGEDMHLSYMFQKYLKLPTFVPPHPKENRSLWGSTEGLILGTDAHSIWESNKDGAKSKMSDYLRLLTGKGWKHVYDS